MAQMIYYLFISKTFRSVRVRSNIPSSAAYSDLFYSENRREELNMHCPAVNIVVWDSGFCALSRQHMIATLKALEMSMTM